MTEVDNILATYELEEIYELNDKTEDEVLTFLVEQKFLVLPTPRPL